MKKLTVGYQNTDVMHKQWKKSRPNLERLYQHYNRKWFNEKLPDNCVLIWDRKRCEREKWYGEADKTMNHPVIRIAYSIRNRPTQIRCTLLHEMVHIKLWVQGVGMGREMDWHGPEFDSEMLKLARQGAFHGIW